MVVGMLYRLVVFEARSKLVVADHSSRGSSNSWLQPGSFGTSELGMAMKLNNEIQEGE
jgi:hypothetical protein